jgi:hypothetical protein
MKKIYAILILPAFILNIKVSAQSPILTAANSNPLIGESIAGQGINYTSPGNAGAAQVWDFSALVSGGTEAFSFIDPSTTANSSSFPTSTVATYNPATTTFNYLSGSSSDISIDGYFYGAPSNTIVPYSNPQKALSYPFSLGSNFIDTYSGTYTSGANTIIRKGTNNVTADGYGTLILPFGTLNNVLRVFTVDAYADTTSLGAPYSQFTLETYNWYLPGVHYPVLALSSLYMNGGTTPVAQFGNYLDESSVGIEGYNLLKSDLSIYPNPANDIVFIRSTEKIKNVNCINYLGQQVDVNFKNNSIDISSLPKGLYFLNVNSDKDKTIVKKIIKE